MHEVVKVIFNGKTEYLTVAAYDLVVGHCLRNKSKTVEEVERYKVLNAADFENKCIT
jgi:hypothetical protein